MEWLTPEIIATIISVIFAILSAIFGAKFAKYKRVVVKIADALDDGKITSKEIRDIISEFTGK